MPDLLGFSDPMYDSDTEDAFMGMNSDYMMSTTLPGIGSLESLASLQHLTVSENALRGTRSRSDDETDGDTQSQRLPALRDLLPASLKTLTILTEEKNVIVKAEELLIGPYAASLENMTVMNNRKQQWFSKADGEGGISPMEK